MNAARATAGKLFRLGELMITPGAKDEFTNAGENPLEYLRRHQAGDWSEMSEHDREANREAVRRGDRVFSSFRLKTETKVWIITEASRDYTTILLPGGVLR